LPTKVEKKLKNRKRQRQQQRPKQQLPEESFEIVDMENDRTSTAPPTPTFPPHSSKIETTSSSAENHVKQRRHSTPHISDGTLLSHRLALLAPKGVRSGQAGLSGGSLRLKNISRVDGIFKDKLPPRSRTGCWTCRVIPSFLLPGPRIPFPIHFRTLLLIIVGLYEKKDSESEMR